ncbi:hypothetical protein BIV57_09035 [Mangrovactinospora gilvigrisea]|uniref:N-acetyltransferase domain-containing protein n=1 Tax=Mangrovactinospora gilvigrisea TaxID=1428644 RepID=A0A1J7BGP2_9ACTN|nr:hypothetical protein BIV57_09035 [Mangrovactinospora gilvigrisea]
MRTLSADELQSAVDRALESFLEEEEPEERDVWNALFEPARTYAAFDGKRIASTAGSFAFRLTVPGGGDPVAAAGVTMVTVGAEYRRRGLLRSMMRRQLDDVRAAGEPLAVLMASEGSIYGRFGYGLASRSVQATVQRRRASVLEVPGIDDYRLRRADTEESLPQCERVHARVVPTRPGMPVRGERWERLAVLDAPGARHGAVPLRTVLAERASDGEVVGYARYSGKMGVDEGGNAEGTLKVKDVEAVEPAAYAALWRHLLAMDLVRDVETRRPSDDPLFALLSDVRLARSVLRDDLYVRLVDVGAALAARRYAREVDVVLEVADAFCGWNAGRWRLRGGPQGAACARTDDAADVVLSVRELGAAYLGSGFASLRGLADAGRVVEVTPGAVAALSAAFASEREPWMPHGF